MTHSRDNHSESNTQRFIDPTIEPTYANIRDSLGYVFETFLAFETLLSEKNIRLEYKYYVDGSAWLGKGMFYWSGIRGGKNEVNIFWLSFFDEFFKITFYFSARKRQELIEYVNQDELKCKIEHSEVMGKKWQFFPLTFEVRESSQLESIKTIIDFKITHR
jgi:hypothetical protein